MRVVPLCVLLLLLVACSDPSIARLERLRDQMCACADQACAEAVLATVPTAGKPRDPDRAYAVLTQLVACRDKLADAGAPASSSTDAGASADDASVAPP